MRVWFNRGFSLAPIAKAMMAADQTLEILVSVGVGKPAYPGPTETFDEPDLEPEAYVLWAMKQIVERNIDLFVPTRYRAHFYRQDMPCACISLVPLRISRRSRTSRRFAMRLQPNRFICRHGQRRQPRS
jgi:hypothetical protein